ncbi:MAG: carbamoyl-phosphate synthase large subunit [Actinomycetota bacterium]
MPRRDDLHSILIVGSGPIVIGQACEFDYSGTQACRVLKADGYRVILVNSNPATIMTDPEFADRTYIEPITPEFVARIIERERPDALLPTLGGQTALNVAVELAEQGALQNVELIGARLDAIKRGEDRRLFRETMEQAGLELPQSSWAYTVDEALAVAREIGYPVIVRPSFLMGGAGSGIAFNDDDLRRIASEGISGSRINEVLIEQSVLGWKEYELEVMRDTADNVVIICAIENLDPMGVHTGDSITVAPAQTLTDREYQAMRDAAITCIRAIGVDTGGSNIQFAVNPRDGRMVVIEMNPRVSRSSALASKATGFPIAKIAAKLAVGYRLDEIRNDITRETWASFEPTIDYVVAKIPRFTFEKFPGADSTLGTAMKSVGEVMAIGRTFPEALQKGLRSMEQGRAGLNADGFEETATLDELMTELARPSAGRIFLVEQALRAGASIESISNATGIDPWFLNQIQRIVHMRRVLESEGRSRHTLRDAKRLGFSDRQIALLTGVTESDVRAERDAAGINAVFKAVDTCAAEFEAETPYFYSTYEDENEARPSGRPTIVILGSGPNRIGQGIEFDYCCVHAAFALKEAGFDTVMINCNPETVSTDYDTSDRLYFEPLTLEDVLAVVRIEKPVGVICQLGGQTPLKLAAGLEAAGVPILGTQPEAIDLAEDRARFGEVLAQLGLTAPPWGTANSVTEARAIAENVGYPVLVRPSYVLGGRGMQIAYEPEALDAYVRSATEISPDHPVFIDHFLEDAIEVDVDAIFDGEELYLGGVLEHIEEAGIHSGDSACVLPPHTLSRTQIAQLRDATFAIAKALGVQGLVNVQYAYRDGVLFVIEANPRASRTVPFTSKATGVPMAKIAARVMAGESLGALRAAGLLQDLDPMDALDFNHVSVKEAVLPFNRFKGVDTLLGPEMKSTGEVMGIDRSFGVAFAKAEEAASARLPRSGNVFISVTDRDKRAIVLPARQLAALGFEIVATKGTADVLRRNGLQVREVAKVGESAESIEPGHVGSMIAEGQIALIINTPSGQGPRVDGDYIRLAAVQYGVPCITTLAGVLAAVQGIEDLIHSNQEVKSLQEYLA